MRIKALTVSIDDADGFKNTVAISRAAVKNIESVIALGRGDMAVD